MIDKIVELATKVLKVEIGNALNAKPLAPGGIAGDPTDWSATGDMGSLDLAALATAVVEAIEPAVARECWESINAMIVRGPLPGNGLDKSAERNGLVMASNVLFLRAFPEQVLSAPLASKDRPEA